MHGLYRVLILLWIHFILRVNVIVNIKILISSNTTNRKRCVFVFVFL